MAVDKGPPNNIYTNFLGSRMISSILSKPSVFFSFRQKTLYGLI